MEELLSQERSSTKPLIKGQENYDSGSWQSSEEEQTIQSVDEMTVSEMSLKSKSSSVASGQNDLLGPLTHTAIENHSKSAATNMSSSPQSKRKTEASHITKSLTSAKGKSKSSRNLSSRSHSCRSLKTSDESSSMKEDARNSRSSAMSKSKKKSSRSIESVSGSANNGEEIKHSSSSKSKHGTSSKSTDLKRRTEPKSKFRSSSSRSLQSDSGKKRHDKTERSIADRLSSFDIV